MNFIKFQNVSFSYENNVILDNISFEINQGESICLVGSNGAGKSTLLQLMTGLLSNYTGSITVENMPVVKKNYNKIRTLLGFVFQDFDSQLFMPTIKQDIAFGLENLDFDNIDQRVNNIAKMLNITDILNKPAFKLSGGEKKLASLGTILAIEPKCILLDEPTTGLDPQSRQNVWQMITKLQKENNMTVFLTTHYMEEVTDADYVIVIDSGEIVAKGTPATLKEKYAKNYLHITPKDKDKLVATLKANNIDFTVIADVYTVDVDKTEDALPIIDLVRDNIESFEVIKGTMDDAFIGITGKEIRK